MVSVRSGREGEPKIVGNTRACIRFFGSDADESVLEEEFVVCMKETCPHEITELGAENTEQKVSPAHKQQQSQQSGADRRRPVEFEELEDEQARILIPALSPLLIWERSERTTMLLSAEKVVACSVDDIIPEKVPFTHSFELEDTMPICQQVRRVPPKYNPIVREEMNRMLSGGIIRPSEPPLGFGVLITKKKGGFYRFCVEFRHLKRRIKAYKWPALIIEELIDEMQGCYLFTTFDLFAVYWNIRLDVSVQ